MNLLDYFRKSAGAGWVCKRAVWLTLNQRKPVRLRPGQVIYTGDFRYQGMDLALVLDMLPDQQTGFPDERPQRISEALQS